MLEEDDRHQYHRRPGRPNPQASGASAGATTPRGARARAAPWSGRLALVGNLGILLGAERVEIVIGTRPAPARPRGRGGRGKTDHDGAGWVEGYPHAKNNSHVKGKGFPTMPKPKPKTDPKTDRQGQVEVSDQIDYLAPLKKGVTSPGAASATRPGTQTESRGPSDRKLTDTEQKRATDKGAQP